MILTYLAAPLTPFGDETRDGNITRAQSLFRALSLQHPDRAFMAPWILNAMVFEETDEFRDIGMRRNYFTILACRELWLAGPRISPGMTAEGIFAEKNGVKVVDLTSALLPWPNAAPGLP